MIRRTIFLLLVTTAGYSQEKAIDSLISIAKIETEKGQLNSALSKLDLAVSLDKENPKAVAARGLLKAGGLSDFKSALEDFNMAIKLKPDEGELYILRGRVSFELKDYKQSQSDFIQAFVLKPSTDYSMYATSYILDNINKSTNNLNPKANEICMRGIQQIQQGEYKKATKIFNEAIELDKSYAYAFALRGMAYQVLEDNKSAMNDYEMAIKLNPYNDLALFGLGEIQNKESKHQAAVETYSGLLELRPDNAIAISELGFSYFKLGDNKKACDLWTKAKEKGDRKAFKYLQDNCK